MTPRTVMGMCSATRLKDVDDPRLAPYRDLKLRGDACEQARFIAEGSLVVGRLLASSYPVESLLLVEREAPGFAVPDGVPVWTVSRSLAEQLVGFPFHRGVLACGRRVVGAVAPESRSPPAGPVAAVVCCGIRDPANLGTVLRNCAAFSCSTVLLGDHCAAPFSRRALRAAMGATFQLEILDTSDLADQLDRLRSAWGIEWWAAVADPAAEPLDRVAVGRPIGLVLGNEFTGINTALLPCCARQLTIPTGNAVDSLNVAVASGIFLYHCTRETRKPVGPAGGSPAPCSEGDDRG